MADKKPHLNLIFVGHVDHGKSTLIGSLFYQTGALTDQELNKLKDEAKKEGAASFELAFFTDVSKEERVKGVTIDLAHRRFETGKYYFTVIDAPGHRDFVKNMITGASQADAAVLVISAQEGIQPQTREHAYLCRVLGIKQLIVAFNKMDLIGYQKEKYEEVKNETVKFLKTVGYPSEKFLYVPVSAKEGEGVSKKSAKMPWYAGLSFAEALDTLQIPEKPIALPLRVPVQDVYQITGVGTVPVGRVETGILKANDKVIIEPSNVVGEVKSIEMHHEQIPSAEPGDNIGFNLRGVTKEQIKRGDVLGHPDNPPTVVKEFTAQIIVLQHPTVLTAGYTPVFHAHTAQVACKIKKIVKKLDPKTGATVQENPDFVKTGDAAVIICEPSKPFVLEKKDTIPQLASFAIRDMGITVGAGICIESVPLKRA